MKSLILGTAGHIDHGKTSLVRMLTGIETDRLKEEKRRGITIELGFAWLNLPDGQRLGIVDVPGHEKFVRTMVAGVGGIDIVCLVVAADEGVMPQTREHFDICRLLQIKHGVIALTKVDMVDDDWLALVTEDLRDYVEGTFLEGAPIVPVSSTTGQGKDKLIAALAETAAEIETKATADLFRLPVDRVFTMKGFGTVITGSCVGGNISVGDTVEILPGDTQAKVRGIQVHGETVETAGAGLRTAVNFQGLDKGSIQRGQTLIKPGTLSPSYLLDVKIDYLPSAAKPLAPRTRIRFHHHTAEILGRVVPLSAESILPGQSGIVQLRLESPAIVLSGDRFVLRSYSPVTTIGGGTVLHPKPRKHKAPFDKALADLDVLEAGELDEKMALMFDGADKGGLRFSELAALLGETEKRLLPVFRDLLSKGALVRIDNDADLAVSSEVFDRVDENILAFLQNFHNVHPTREGIGSGELAAKILYGISPKLLSRVIAKLEKANQVKKENDLVSLAEHRASLQGNLEEYGNAIAEALKNGGATPPTLKELVPLAGDNPKITRQILDLMVNNGQAVRIAEGQYYAAEAIAKLTALVENHLEKNGEIDAQEFKSLTGTSRKFAIPLLEYFDSIKLTLRVGDKRIARKSK